MKIGILTFHWATNYGAVLQAYALQEYLRNEGHEVEIINYKPWHFDFWKCYLRRPWLLQYFHRDWIGHNKELKLKLFRKNYLCQTKRYFSAKQIAVDNLDYDWVISGSDQILNDSFTLSGENSPTPAYYLQSFPNAKRIGYAVSFGCNEYPVEALQYAKRWINNFDKVGVREQTGLSILESMEYKGPKQIVPDPTILCGKELFKDIKIEYPEKKGYICAYILRKHIDFKEDNVIYIDDFNNPLSMEQWLGTIMGSKGLITNSYHGMIIAILNQVPFAVIADAAHMNDRFYTLLENLGLTDHIITSIDNYSTSLAQPIDWKDVEFRLAKFRKAGEYLLNNE
ncbi:polysaccharide pyruvyl transferase family protein [Bacteroides caccae]|uniref:Polysaccharide pyruvyl transferase family protein n=1 Tax=Bacteroides caccae TaxID=47678 RepID=A0A6A1K685_9BACE|nr:polysaccharide pyruvyl transferase family protein [Bacteroides caccae]KAA5476063.1 polysaccharide pyruvyl transferase family protein [Bacteroides caccae]KAA5486989.1 polysaccharide pyruvyl transferase family protein [Bacteroides caccae]KAA5487352.1 polysaccharide pyruvyl transferase family protein [Bacteroides caccae]KAA5501387.1 polysaccharide pyruvyl transferase family protein [Bacteroides caccae]